MHVVNVEATKVSAKAAIPIGILPLATTKKTGEKGKRMKRSLYPPRFGRRVKILREDMRLSQPELVKMVNDRGVDLTQSYLSKLENSEDHKVPNGEVVGALAKVLETTADFLLCLADDPDVTTSGKKEEIGLHPETSRVAELMDDLSPDSRKEVVSLVETIYKAEADARAANARKFRRLLDTIGRVAGPEVRAQIEQSILTDSLEVSGNSIPQ